MGTMRTGPDLFNIGARQPSVDWHMTHLYAPRSVSPGSNMPGYPFLFDVIDFVPEGAVAVTLPPEYRVRGGTVIARPEAIELVAYLLAMDRTYPADVLPQAPVEEEASSASVDANRVSVARAAK
jgi:cytochrome c oxidase cbb3-type subunit 2